MTVPSSPYVLVVEPNPEMRQLLVMRLECFDCRIREATDTSELDAVLSQTGAEIVVTAWSIPGLEGMDLLKRLEPRRRRVLLLTENEPEMNTASLNLLGLDSVHTYKKRSSLFKRVEELLPQVRRTSPEPALPVGSQILLVDDSSAIRMFLRKCLESSLPGAVIREAADGVTAIAEMSKKKVDLIVTDLEMPGMDGRTFLRKIRQNPILRNKPILILSGSLSSELSEEFKGDPALLFVAKPCSPEVLRQSALQLLHLDPKGAKALS
jgi:two-component system chemotaxis response regulator CheY